MTLLAHRHRANCLPTPDSLYTASGSRNPAPFCDFCHGLLDVIFEVDVSASTSITYSNVRGSFPGTGNINTDPLFVDAAGGDYRLQAGSPCIDAGDPATTLTEDIDGNSRPAGSGYDMGAYEYTP
jgi:hypothetical protein